MIHTMNDPCDDKVTAAYMAGVIEGASSQPASSTEAAEEQIALLAKTKAETDKKIEELNKAIKASEKALAEQLKIKDELAQAKEAADAQAVNAEEAKREVEEAKREAEAEKKAAEEELSKAEAAKVVLEQEKAEFITLQTKTQTEAVATLEREKKELTTANKEAKAALAEQKASNTKLVAAVAAARKAATQAKDAQAEKAAADKQTLAKANKEAGAALAVAQEAATKALAEKAAANKALNIVNVALDAAKKENVEAEARVAAKEAEVEALEEAKAVAAQTVEEKVKEAVEAAQAEAKKKADEAAKEKLGVEAKLTEVEEANVTKLQRIKAEKDALAKEKKAAEAKLAEAKEAEEKAEKAQADAQKLAEEKAEAEAYKIKEARNKIKSQILNNTGKDIYGDIDDLNNTGKDIYADNDALNNTGKDIYADIDFLLDRLKITETVGKNAELDFSKAKKEIVALQTQLDQATRETENAKEELRSATTKAEDILRSLKAKEVVANVVNTGLQNIVMKKGNAGNTGNTSDTQTGNNSESSESESEEEEGGGDNDDRPPVNGLSTEGVTLEESLSVFQKYGEELIRKNASKQTIVEQLDQLKRTSRLKEETLQDSLTANANLSEKLAAVTKDKKALGVDYDTLAATDVKLKQENKKLSYQLVQKSDQNKKLSTKVSALEEKKNELGTQYDEMRDKLQRQINDLKNEKKIRKETIQTQKKEIIAKRTAISELETSLTNVNENNDKTATQNQKLILANTKLEKTLTSIRELVEVKSNEDLIDELTKVKGIIDEANRDGADLTFETLPDYIKKYRLLQRERLLNEKPDMKKLESLNQKLTRFAEYLAGKIFFNTEFTKIIPAGMIEDLANTVTIRNALRAYVNRKNQGAQMNKAKTTSNAELLIEYYSANYDKFIEHLELICTQTIAFGDDIYYANQYSEFINYMIKFGDTLLNKNKLFTDTQHLTDARIRLNESTKLGKLIKKNNFLKQQLANVDFKDTSRLGNTDVIKGNLKRQIQGNNVLIKKLANGISLNKKELEQINAQIKSKAEGLPVASSAIPVDEIPVANSRQNKMIQGIELLDKKKRIPSREGFVRVRF